jgi:hypothetical protein
MQMPGTADAFRPVACDVEALMAESMEDPGFAEEWNRPDPEIKALDAVLKARGKAGPARDDGNLRP